MSKHYKNLDFHVSSSNEILNIILSEDSQFQPLLQNSSFIVFVSEVKTKNRFFRPLGPLIVEAFLSAFLEFLVRQKYADKPLDSFIV